LNIDWRRCIADCFWYVPDLFRNKVAPMIVYSCQIRIPHVYKHASTCDYVQSITHFPAFQYVWIVHLPLGITEVHAFSFLPFINNSHVPQSPFLQLDIEGERMWAQMMIFWGFFSISY
jgi:hypothetical protein